MGPVDDRGSMTFAMLLIVVGVSLTALLSPTVLGQIQATRSEVQRGHALHAAQAGLDVALGHIRAVGDSDGNGNGTPKDLPCGPFTGNVDPAGNSSYTVHIYYLDDDPAGSWYATDPIPCTSTGTHPIIPNYALLVADGVDRPTGSSTQAAHRSLKATYTFQSASANIPGGLIRVYKSYFMYISDLCLDAGSADPPAGTDLKVRNCVTGSAQQTFAYNPDLTLNLVSSKKPSQPLGMCVDVLTPRSSGKPVELNPCTATPAAHQQWSYNGSANFRGTTDGVKTDNYCFSVPMRSSGSSVVLSNWCGQMWWSNTAFVPDPTVGPGASGAASGQLVNAGNGRCAEAPTWFSWVLALAGAPCNQLSNLLNMFGIDLFGSQVWDLPNATNSAPATGRIETASSWGFFAPSLCLQSVNNPWMGGQYVWTGFCGFSAQQQTWKVYRRTSDPLTSYTIRDYNNYCLTMTKKTGPSWDYLQYNFMEVSKITVAQCDGSLEQKWNAPVSIAVGMGLKDYNEK
jgi:hypothetical protein